MKHKGENYNTLGINKKLKWQKPLLPLLAIFFLFGAVPVAAEEKSADEWQYDLQVYVWGATIKTATVTGESANINFGTILKNLDMVVMTTLGARKNKFSMLADVIYMDISDSQKHNGEFLGRPVEGKLELGIKSWVLNLIGGYNLVDNEKSVFDITAGARYLDLTVDTTVKLNDNKLKTSEGGSGWDGVVGFKGRHNYSDGHYLNYYADIGGGDSKLTWQALVNFAYDYKKFTGIVGYRYLTWNLKDDSPALDDMTIHGPYIAAKWSF